MGRRCDGEAAHLRDRGDVDIEPLAREMGEGCLERTGISWSERIVVFLTEPQSFSVMWNTGFQPW